MKVQTCFKEYKYIKLTGKAKQAFREAVFDRDGWCCVDCGTPYNLTLSHTEHAGLGGGKGAGDTMDNCETRCMTCHLHEEMNLYGKKKG